MHQAPCPFAIATWNVNSVKARLPHLLDLLGGKIASRHANPDDFPAKSPDIVLLQETKCTDDAFPRLEIEDLGYNIAHHGEKSYNGVAILSRFPLEDVRCGLPGGGEDAQARYIEAVVSLPAASALRVASVYVPNGQEVGSDKYAYKLRFYERLRAHAKKLLSYEEMLVIGGDYNVAPYETDVHNPGAWANTVLCHPLARAQWRALTHMGLYDAWPLYASSAADSRVGVAAGTAGAYTWWDYRAGGFARDDGLRIDHLLLSPQAADRLESCRVLKELRALERASDHAPVLAELRII